MGKEKETKETKDQRQSYKSLTDLRRGINKRHGDGAIMYGKDSIVAVESFPTNVASIDKATGCCGLPQGRIIEVFGLESSGKTTTCLQFIAACQSHYFEKKKRKGVAAFIDVEHAFDRTWAGKCGVNVDDLLFSQPDSGEEAIDIVDQLVRSGFIDLIVVDSVAALVPQAELDGEITEHHVGAQARLLSKGLRVLKGEANKSKTTIIFVNQIRQKIGVMYGDPNTTSGGLALKFYASIRASISKGSAVKDGSTITAFRPTLKIIKNKCAPPFTDAEYDICVGTPELPIFGVDTASSLIEVGYDLGIIEKSGNFYAYGDQRLGNGLFNSAETLRKSPELYKTIREKIYGSFQRTAPVIVEETPDADELADDILDRVTDGDD